MRAALFSLALVALLPLTLAAHDSAAPHRQAHTGMAGPFDHVPPRREYYGHFVQGRVQHGAAIHGGGHLNAEAVIPRFAQLAVEPDGTGFAILVTPNLVNRASARAAADQVAVAFCRGRRAGFTRVSYEKVQRYAPQRLDSWLFRGTCR